MHRLAHRRIILVVALLVAVVGLAACTPQQEELYDRINASRAEAGLPDLLPHLSAMDQAQAWAEHLAATGTLAHSPDPRGALSGTPGLVAENVGMGSSIAEVHETFLASPAHRNNILSSTYNFVGVGHAVAADGTVFVVQVFAQY